jgi:hypothetical protein
VPKSGIESVHVGVDESNIVAIKFKKSKLLVFSLQFV